MRNAEEKTSVGHWLIQGLDQTELPGRMEWFGTKCLSRRTPDLKVTVPVLLDGAHVPFNLQLVIHDIAKRQSLPPRCIVVFGLARDKDAQGMLSVLRTLASRVIFTTWTGGAPTYTPQELLVLANEKGLPSEAWDDPDEALRRACDLAVDDGWIFVTGSLHLIGKVRAKLGGKERV